MYLVEVCGGQYEDKWHSTIAVCETLNDAHKAINNYVMTKIANGYQYAIEDGYHYFSDDSYPYAAYIHKLTVGTIEEQCDVVVERHCLKWPDDLEIVENMMHDYHNLVNNQTNMDQYLLSPITQGEWIQMKFDFHKGK